MKKILFSLLVTFTIIFSVSTTMANQRIAMLEKNAEANKMAMVFANSAIHEFYNQSKETL